MQYPLEQRGFQGSDPRDPMHHKTPTLRARSLRRSVALPLGLVTLLATNLACNRRADVDTAPPSAANDSGQDVRPGLELDEGRMFAALEHLASDELAGRYTLSDDLRVAADYIAKRYSEMGAGKVGESYDVTFPLVTGAKVQGEPVLELSRGKRRIAGDAFVPLAASSSGTAKGPIVFVGYAAKAEPVDPDPEDEDDKGRPGYDDLAGIDLEGKIALVLLDSPGRPDVRKLFGKLQEVSEEFESKAKPLREKNDESGMAALHKSSRKRIAAMIEPFLVGKPVPKEMLEVPEKPVEAELDLQALLAPVMRMAMEQPGPNFGFNAGSTSGKLERLSEAGAVGAIFVRGPRSFIEPADRKADALEDPADAGIQSGDNATIPAVQMRWKVADRSFRIGGKKLSAVQEQIDSKLAPHSKPLGKVEATMEVQLEPIAKQVPNVLATIPGTDLANEIVMLGAHYDHLGRDEGGRCGRQGDDGICNGADDNASGTAMVLEIAQAFLESGRKPRRTIVFAHFAGEELGLFGSKALAQNPPVAPPFTGGKVVAMVNLDMVGRLGPRGLAIGGISSSDGWMPLLDEIGTGGLEVLYDRSIASRSDHANFYRQKIPVLFYFTHVHKDYHRAGDHSDKINRDGMAKIGDLVSRLMVAVADGHALPFAEPKTPAEGLAGGLPGSNPDTVEKRVKAE